MLIPLYIILLVQQMCLCVDLTYSVEEGRRPGTYVGDIAADSHLLDTVTSQDRNQITFSQLPVSQADGSQLFCISKKTGKLYTVHTVDTESMCTYNKECFKMVEVAVQKGTSFIKVLEIKVMLKDINDNQPKFPVTQVHIEISERDSKGTKILIPNAVDNDIGDRNSQITYELKKKRDEPFILSISKSIDGTSKLFINLEEKLDREEKDTYSIQVIAKDGGSPPNQSTLDVHIAVTDVNDNIPIFSQKVYNVSIKNEPSETSAILILSARDLDSGEFGRITYHFSSKTSDVAKAHFKLNKVTGEIFLSKRFTLGQELTNKLYVEATDGGTPPLSSIALVLVNVINQQNNAPTIDVNFVSKSSGNMVSIPEDTTVDSFIAYVRVTDHDAGQNGEVSCVLYHDKFQLQSLGKKRYKVILKKPLDREIDEYHDITITCQDKGTPRLHSESKFTIHVMDVSDVQPQFSRKIYKFSINENQKAKFHVGYINATDPDLGPGGKLTYSLLSDNKYFLPFQISDSGLITTVMSLDHEFQDIYEFQILVKDNGKPPLNNTVNVIVEVRDENDNVPYFIFPSMNPFTMDVVYYPHHTINITVLRATDSDSRENAFLKYEITSGNDKQLFTINQYTGLLSFTRVVTQYDAKTYDLEFVVKDSGSPVLSATTTVILIVSISNKTSEIFKVPTREDETEENIQFDFLIAIVSVAVTVSVVITAIISICYIRYNDRRKDSQRNKTNFSTKCEQRQLMCPSYLAASCNDVPVAGTEHHPERLRGSQVTNSRAESHLENLDTVQKGIASGIDLQTASEVIYQEIESGGKRGKKTAPMYPDCHRVISMLTSHTESVDGWNNTDTTHSAESQDQYSSHYSLAHTPWIDQNTCMKPMKQRFSCPVDTRMSPRCLHKPNNNSDIIESRQWTGLKHSKPWTLPESKRPVFGFPQLPSTSAAAAVAQVDYQRNVDHLMQLPLPKYYVLEQPSLDISPQIQHPDSPGEIEQSLQLPLPKYYVLEPGTQTPVPIHHSDDSEEVEHFRDIVQLPLPKYYVLEPDSQNRPQSIDNISSSSTSSSTSSSSSLHQDVHLSTDCIGFNGTDNVTSTNTFALNGFYLIRNMLVPVYALLSVLHRCLCVDLTYYVEEGRSSGSYVGDIAADSHLMDNVPLQDRSLITFSQLQVRWAGSSQLFSVNKKTGKLYTSHTLDTESMCKHNKECFKMVEVAVEMGTSFMKILEIKVILKDINDNPPEFPVKQVSIQFEEDDSRGVRRSIPNAIDKDIGVVNSLITYHLKKNANDPFTLSVSKSIDGTSKLFINLEKKLDREVQDSYMVQVIAKDGGSPPKQSVLDVHISVTDVNDNSPIFTQKFYNVSIKNEPSETSPAVVLLAKDLDKNRYGRVTYHFSSKTSEVAKSHFEINEMTGEIFLHKKFTLGRELTYKLYVEAMDGGNPPLSSIAMVLMNVINEQNNAPTIDVNFVSASTGNIVSIPENIKVGSFIAYIRVTDHDAGLNGEVSCVLHHDKFQLQSLGTKKYKVILKKPLDRETKSRHEITISCQDKGTPRLHSENRFEIQVVDVNDVRPQFSRKIYKFSINENQKAKFPVGYINATDPDLGPGGKLTYSLLSDNKHFLPFQINDDGLISTVMSLDHEFQAVYEFQVFIKDNGKPPLNNSVDVIVEVRDENDNAPYFIFPSISPFTMDFVYYPHHTKNITLLKASDSDSRQNAFLRYEITRGNDKQLFTINHYTGLLSFTHVVTQQDTGSYELEFVVKDSGSPVLSARTTLILILTVSNKTFEMPNVIHMQANESEENIQLDILIAIVSVAVSVSVVITAFISICYIRYYNRKKDTQQSEVNYSNKCEQRQLMCLSYLAASCTDVPVVETEHLDMSRNSYLTENRRESQHTDKLDIRQIGPASGMDLQAASEVIYQEIGMTSGGKKRKKTALMYPDCHREASMVSSHIDCVDSWNDGDIIHDINVNVQDQYSSHYSLAHTPWIDQNTFMTPIKQRFSCPVDAKMSPRYMRKSNIEEPFERRQQAGLVPAKPWTLPESRRPNFDFPQLPTVGQSDYQGNVDHLVQLPLPKYYVLEQNPDNSPQVPHRDSSVEVDRSVQLPLPKYYVLERNSQTPPLILYPEYPEETENLNDTAQSPLPKDYVLEPDSQNRPQVTYTETSYLGV